MYKWLHSEKAQKLANAELEKLGGFKMPERPLYHYTSREVFWKIIETESFLARHIIFSNDYKENVIGTEMVEKAKNRLGIVSESIDTLPFMVCFCEKEDLLSQWRGYANEGVAIEFDFSKGLYALDERFSSYHCFTIMNGADMNCKEFLTSTTKNGMLGTEEKYVTAAIVSPYKVFYENETNRHTKRLRNVLKEIADETGEQKKQHLNDLIPYIKSIKFSEEEEFRLIFDLRKLMPDSAMTSLEEKYYYLDVNGIKKPNIRVKFGDVQKATNNEIIRIFYCDNELENVLNQLKTECNKAQVNIALVQDKNSYPLEKCEILVESGRNQKQICTRLRLLMRQQVPAITNVKIWCDGHLPIRRIIVAPSRDAEFMKHSIEEYLKTKYWMMDITVEISKIPLRT